jgi:hypothetical protein
MSFFDNANSDVLALELSEFFVDANTTVTRAGLEGSANVTTVAADDTDE